MIDILSLVSKLISALLNFFSSGSHVSANTQINSGDQSLQVNGSSNHIVNHNIVNNIKQIPYPHAEYIEFQKSGAEASERRQAEYDKLAQARGIRYM